MRKINISKYEGNTHYSIHVIDSFGQEHHLGYYNEIPHEGFIHSKAEEIWLNETKNVNEHELLHKAILNCKELDKNNNNLRSIL